MNRKRTTEDRESVRQLEKVMKFDYEPKKGYTKIKNKLNYLLIFHLIGPPSKCQSLPNIY